MANNVNVESNNSKTKKTIETKSKLWNLNFILLWQGQLVSNFGDSVYDIALGFWILAKTGSTGLMGILMATAVIPRVFLSPIAGTYVDRHNRKNILIITDVIRGIVISFVGVAAIMNFIQIWMVLLGGILAEFISISIIISVGFSIILILFFALGFMKPVKQLIDSL